MLDKESRFHIYETFEYWNHKIIDRNDTTMLNYYSYLFDERHRNQTNNIRVRWMRSQLHDNARILDLGCSDGLLVKRLSEAGFHAIGMDCSHSMVAYGQKKNNVKLIQADFEKDWPFTEPFDAITCYAALSNFVSASRVFEQIQLHLKPRGYFFFNFGDPHRLVARIFRNRHYLYRPTSALIYSKKVIQKYCQKFGLRVVTMKNDVQIVPLARFFGFLRMPRLLRMLELVGLQDLHFKTILPTGYRVCAIKEAHNIPE